MKCRPWKQVLIYDLCIIFQKMSDWVYFTKIILKTIDFLYKKPKISIDNKLFEWITHKYKHWDF